jgi:hypothetical protein
MKKKKKLGYVIILKFCYIGENIYICTADKLLLLLLFCDKLPLPILSGKKKIPSG